MKNTIPLDSVLNDEQLLDFALSHICERDSHDVHPAASAILVRYAANSMGREAWSEEQLNQRCSELIAEHIVGDLVKKDLVDYRIKEDGEIVYSVTPKGKEKILAELDLTSGDSTV
jgi:hypothetical protein